MTDELLPMLDDELATPTTVDECDMLQGKIEKIATFLKRRLPNGWTIEHDVAEGPPFGIPVVVCRHDYLPAGERLIIAPTGSPDPNDGLTFAQVTRRFCTRLDSIDRSCVPIEGIVDHTAMHAMDRYHTDGPRWSPLTALARGADADFVSP